MLLPSAQNALSSVASIFLLAQRTNQLYSKDAGEWKEKKLNSSR